MFNTYAVRLYKIFIKEQIWFMRYNFLRYANLTQKYISVMVFMKVSNLTVNFGRGLAEIV